MKYAKEILLILLIAALSGCLASHKNSDGKPYIIKEDANSSIITIEVANLYDSSHYSEALTQGLKVVENKYKVIQVIPKEMVVDLEGVSRGSYTTSYDVIVDRNKANDGSK